MSGTRPPIGLPNPAWLRSFEAAARTSSFAAAALELRLTSGAISYQIRALESHLGCALFERLPRGVKLTPMGVAYLPPVRKAFEELADSTVGLFGASERVQVTVHAPVSLAALWLAVKIPAFEAAHPSIDIRMASLIWDNAGPDESTDLEIRYGRGHWHGYRAQHLMNQPILAVCSPGLRDAARARGDFDPLAPPNLIHIMGYEDHWLKVREGLGLANLTARSGPTVDTTLAALELAASGLGCALSHRVFLAPYLSSGRLVMAIDREFEDDNSYFVLTPERPQRPRREVAVCREWLMAVAADSTPGGDDLILE